MMKTPDEAASSIQRVWKKFKIAKNVGAFYIDGFWPRGWIWWRNVGQRKLLKQLWAEFDRYKYTREKHTGIAFHSWLIHRDD